MNKWIGAAFVLCALSLAAPASARVQVFESIIADTNAVGTGCDSSAVYNTSGYKRFWLAIYINPAAGVTTPMTQIAVQVRAHTSSVADSNTTFPWHWSENMDQVLVNDTLSFGHRTLGAQTVPASSEVTVTGRLNAANKWGGNKGIWLPLCFRGQWFSAPWTSIRVRSLNANGTTSVANVSRITVHLVGDTQ